MISKSSLADSAPDLASGRSGHGRANEPDGATSSTTVDRCRQVIASTAPFDAWPAEAQRKLALASSIVHFPRGATLATRGRSMRSLLLIAEGSADSRLTAYNGKQFTIVTALKGWVFGLIPLLDGQDLPHDLVAAEDVTVVKLPMTVVQAVLQQSPVLWASVAAELARRFRNLHAITWKNHFDPPHVLLARALLALVDTHGQPETDGVKIRVRLSQETVGSLLGVSRQSATQYVGDLVDRGLITWRYGQATVLDVAALRNLVQREGVFRE